MTDQKTIAIFGAGTGLGASVAARFGREGYKVALIARGPTGLDLLKGKLAEQGIEAYSFPADLTDLAAIPSLVQAIEAQLGSIDVALFSPISSTAYFVPAVDLEAQLSAVDFAVADMGTNRVGSCVDAGHAFARRWRFHCGRWAVGRFSGGWNERTWPRHGGYPQLHHDAA